MSETTHLTLPTWAVGSLNIRLIYLVNNTTFRLSESPNKDCAVPLYLGADLLSHSDIRTENHPRCHAKFAKKGLATKLHFPSVYRFHGIRLPSSNNSLWFYSVQGLFRIAFEMFNKHDQLSVLERFQDIWKSHLDDAPLQMCYNLSEQSDSASNDTGPRTETPESFKESQTPQDTRGDSRDHDYCSPENPAEEEESDALTSLRLKVQKLSDGLPQIQPEQLRTITVLLDFIDRFAQGDVTDAAATEAVMALLHAKRRDGDGVYSSALLRGVGRWLGRQFHEANGSISQKVEGFKEQHIERISDLPPPEELSKQLFPDAMLSLLLHWMGLSEDWSAQKRNSEYPILLLILEFANHNLITGVAHVLYSSLICK